MRMGGWRVPTSLPLPPLLRCVHTRTRAPISLSLSLSFSFSFSLLCVLRTLVLLGSTGLARTARPSRPLHAHALTTLPPPHPHPTQVSIVACSMAWQFAIHFGGFGGGRPAFTPEDHQFARQRGVMTVSDAYWAPVRWFWAGVYGFCDVIAPYIMNNPKNAPLLVPILGLSVWTPAVFFCFLRWHLEAKAAGLGFSFGMAFAYRVLQMGPYFKFFANAAVMIHKEGHANKTKKGLFKGPLSPVLNHICTCCAAVALTRG